MFSRKKNQAVYGFSPRLEQYPNQSSLQFTDYNGRQQPFHYPYPAPPFEWSSNSYPTPYQQGFVNSYPYGQGQGNLGAMPFIGQSSAMSHSYAQNIFQNPLQPQEPDQPYYHPNSVGEPPGYYPNAYPKHAFMPKQPSGIQSVMNSFKAQDGSVDFNKMINTAGQMMSAVSQVSNMVKGLGGMLKV
jgi:hypothetical protein